MTQERIPGGRRRWFDDDGMELIVWYGPGGTPAGFQLCYEAEDGREHALTWRPAAGFSHARVETGDSRPDKNMTPILVADGAVPWEWIRDGFARRAPPLEPELRELVLAALAGRET